MNNQFVCPADFISIDENRVRVTASFVFLLSVIFLITGFWPVIAFLLYDFGVRAFNRSNCSLLNIISGYLVKLLVLRAKPVDRAPKRFAARIGLLMNAAILTAYLSGFIKLAFLFSSVIVLFSFLESVFSFCAGCYIYTFWKQFLGKVLFSAQS